MKINEEEEGNPVKATIHQQQNPLSNYNDQVNKGDRPTNNESKTHKQRPSCLFTHLSLFIAEQPNTRTRALSTPLSFVFLSFLASYPSPARTGIRNKLQLNPSRSAQCLAHLNPLLSLFFSSDLEGCEGCCTSCILCNGNERIEGRNESDRVSSFLFFPSLSLKIGIPLFLSRDP